MIIGVGLVLLLAGRRVFWLAAALAVFVFAYRWLQAWIGPGPQGWIIAAVIGLVIGGLAVRFLQAIGYLFGALAGAVGVPLVLGLLGVHASAWVLALVGAVLGILVVSLALDVGLVLVTAWLGASLISGVAKSFPAPDSPLRTVIFVALLLLGIGAQFAQRRRRAQYS